VHRQTTENDDYLEHADYWNNQYPTLARTDPSTWLLTCIHEA